MLVLVTLKGLAALEFLRADLADDDGAGWRWTAVSFPSVILERSFIFAFEVARRAFVQFLFFRLSRALLKLFRRLSLGLFFLCTLGTVFSLNEFGINLFLPVKLQLHVQVHVITTFFLDCTAIGSDWIRQQEKSLKFQLVVYEVFLNCAAFVEIVDAAEANP